MAHNYDRNTLFSVDGIVAVITGGGSGLGAVMAHALDANGAKAVYILGRREGSLKAVADKAKNGTIKTIVCDVTSKDKLLAAADQVRKEQGFINLLVANSGITGPSVAHLWANGKQPSVKEIQHEILNTPTTDFTNVFEVNVTAAIYTVAAFLDLLDEGNKRRTTSGATSQVITTSSIAAYARLPAVGFAYSASKAAVVHTTKQLATAFAPHKIRFNSIAPGFYPSELTENMPFMTDYGDSRKEGALDWKVVPAQRVGTEEDMAGMMVFMASKAGGYLDGAILLTDGGRLSVMPASW